MDTPQAVLWDFDGTLVDTEPRWIETELKFLADHGIQCEPEELYANIGQSAHKTAAQFAEMINLPAEQIYQELHDRLCDLLRAHDLPWLPGSHELASELQELGVPMALVTASNGQIMNTVASMLPDFFDVIVHADHVRQYKPHPESYHLAMAKLGVTPDQVVVLEDSIPGVTAAHASGAVVLAVPKMNRIEPAPRLLVREEGLDGITWQHLVEIWRKERM